MGGAVDGMRFRRGVEMFGMVGESVRHSRMILLISYILSSPVGGNAIDGVNQNESVVQSCRRYRRRDASSVRHALVVM